MSAAGLPLVADDVDTSTLNLHVVIRSVGERTESLCRKLILDQGLPPARVTQVGEVPFSATLRKSFEAGVQSGSKWTLCVDADILLRPGSIGSLVSLAEQQQENVCELQGYVMDKFFGGPRQAGLHLYRSSLLPQAMACIPDEGVNIRPEYHTLRAMRKAGFPWLEVPLVLGLHDAEQYYRDVYRKCFVHAHKHAQYAELLMEVWKQGAVQDSDYRVALRAFADGIQHMGPVRIDVRQSCFTLGLEDLGLQEKAPINPEKWNGQRVESVVDAWSVARSFERYFDMPREFGGPAARLSRVQRIRQAVRRKGAVKGLLDLAGTLLQGVGRRLVRLSG